MPLKKGSSRRVINANTREMIKSPTFAPDKPPAKRAQMASAAAHRNARKGKAK